MARSGVGVRVVPTEPPAQRLDAGAHAPDAGELELAKLVHDALASPKGSTPSWRSIPRSSRPAQCSTNLPSWTRKMWICSVVIVERLHPLLNELFHVLFSGRR